MLELAEKIHRDLVVSSCMKNYGLEEGIIYTTDNSYKVKKAHHTCAHYTSILFRIIVEEFEGEKYFNVQYFFEPTAGSIFFTDVYTGEWKTADKSTFNFFLENAYSFQKYSFKGIPNVNYNILDNRHYLRVYIPTIDAKDYYNITPLKVFIEYSMETGKPTDFRYIIPNSVEIAYEEGKPYLKCKYGKLECNWVLGYLLPSGLAFLSYEDCHTFIKKRFRAWVVEKLENMPEKEIAQKVKVNKDWYSILLLNFYELNPWRPKGK